MTDTWLETTLGAIADINPESTPKWGAERQNRYVDIASVARDTGINLESVERYAFPDAPGRARRRIRANDVLVSTVRPNLRAFAVVPEDLDGEVASTGFAVLRAKPGALPGFIWCLVQSESFVTEMVGRCTGSNYPAVRADDVAAFPVLLPPLAVQRRLVDLMAHLDNHLANLRAERSSVRKLLMAAGRTPPRLDRWPLKPLGDVARLYQPVTLSKADIQAGGPYVVFGANGPIGTHTDFNHADSQVAVTCRGATCGTVNWTPPNCWITGNAMVVSSDEAAVRKRFAYWALQYLVDVSTTISGSAQPQITRTSLAPLLFPVPPLDEQDAYITTLDEMALLEQAVNREIEALTRFRAQLLSGLLTAELDIPDTYDVLLDQVA